MSVLLLYSSVNVAIGTIALERFLIAKTSTNIFMLRPNIAIHSHRIEYAWLFLFDSHGFGAAETLMNQLQLTVVPGSTDRSVQLWRHCHK